MEKRTDAVLLLLSKDTEMPPTHQRPREEKPFALIKLEVDLKVPLPITKEEFDNIVVITDPCRNYAEMHPIRGQTRPQENVDVERINRTMGEALTKLEEKHPNRWFQHLPDVQLAHNTAVHTNTGVSPYELVFKDQLRSKFEILTL
ncbi:Transposon Ty3-I Gag-Pol poly [Paramuricea clavata]|uniref:Transposon Ty3-I Gag-Pol poly n=1 Tax=Paramuricea clavata TaxID=317549 RepID=A0A6S7KIA7_PARCT|nr:Transposon Ty3-I Gag-Pol poly [Paramuricea clavata]